MAAAAIPPFTVDEQSGTVSVGASSVELRWAGITHPGLVREANEDAICAYLGLFAVCDGMGGHRGGARASHVTVDELRSVVPGASPVAVRDVVQALLRANDEVLTEGQSSPELQGMGTTAAVLAFVDNGGRCALVAANVGDSRIYRMDAHHLDQVSTDHSVIQELLDAGSITREEALIHRERHVVTRVIGSEPSPDVDVWILEPSQGQRFLLCSDGIHGEVSHTELEQALELTTPADAARALAQATFATGARDNLSAVVIDVVGREDDYDASAEDTLPRATVAALAGAITPAKPTVVTGGIDWPSDRALVAKRSSAPISEVPGA